MPGIADIFRRVLAPPPRHGRALALVDLHEHTRGGHFGAWLRWFAGELALRFDELHVVTPDPALTRTLFAAAPPPANVSFHALPKRLRRRFDLAALRGLDGLRHRQLAAFVMWGYDLLHLKPSRGADEVPWAALAGISWSRRGHREGTALLEERLQALFRASPSCRAFVQPDQYLKDDGGGRAVWIPDVEEVELPAQPTARAARIRAHVDGHPSVGAYGMLSGYRCLNELLPLAQAQPDVRFVIAGRIAEDTVSAELRPLLGDGALPNVLVLPGFIPTEPELNEAVATTDAVFIDGRSYPVQSGVACKAVHFGRGVLSPRSNSWTCDFIDEHGAGVVYEQRTDPIAERLARWSADGGAARSRAASAAVRDAAGVAACFDRIARDLTTGWEQDP